MNRKDWAKLKITHGPGVFFTCGCFACQFDRNAQEGYGLVAFRNPDGPAAVIGACDESYAAMGQLALDGLFGRFSAPPAPGRLGDYWLDAQAGLDHGQIDPLTFQLYDQVDGSRGKVPLADQRREHLEMWMLLGDPALRMPLAPADIRLEVAGSISPGARITVKGVLPERLAGAAVHVTLERPIASFPEKPKALPNGSDKTPDEIMLENHRRANSVVLAEQEVKSSGVNFECSLDMPGTLPWKDLILRRVGRLGNRIRHRLPASPAGVEYAIALLKKCLSKAPVKVAQFFPLKTGQSIVYDVVDIISSARKRKEEASGLKLEIEEVADQHQSRCSLFSLPWFCSWRIRSSRGRKNGKNAKNNHRNERPMCFNRRHGPGNRR